MGNLSGPIVAGLETADLARFQKPHQEGLSILALAIVKQFIDKLAAALAPVNHDIFEVDQFGQMTADLEVGPRQSVANILPGKTERMLVDLALVATIPDILM